MSEENRKPPPLPPKMAQRLPPPVPKVARRVEGGARKGTLLSPGELEQYGNLLLFARATVEGYFAGKHKSPYRGSSVEFTDYKEYVPGDDLNRIDWRAYGRSRRLYVRQYEAETDMVAYVLVDVSASMGYAGRGLETKYILAAKIAAALSYLMIHQGDKAPLGLFADKLRRYVGPGGTRGHLHSVVTELETARPAATTGIANALVECSALFKKRGRLVVISDFWDDVAGTFEALSRFLHRKYEILLLQVAHPDEMNLPSVYAARFHDMETHQEVEIEPEEIRAAYREAAHERMQMLARESHNRGISHGLVSADRPYLDAIEAYMGFRGRDALSRR